MAAPRIEKNTMATKVAELTDGELRVIIGEVGEQTTIDLDS